MLNQIVIAGRLATDPQVNETETGRKEVILTIAVPRSYKNVDGTYDTDFIDCLIWNGIAETTLQSCKKGDIMGIRGRMQTERIENEDGSISKKMIVIAEKVSFLSSRKSEEN